MKVELNSEDVTAIENILKNGNDAIVRKNGQELIVMEEKRKKGYSRRLVGSRERTIGVSNH